jgi:2-polyprenyl-6-methoxyphenol hydroxylase-like FAD-dependent oxidoreductase
LSEGRSVWRGVAPSLQCNGQATFFRGDGGSGGSANISALVFPAGAKGGASWTVIAPTVEGRAVDEADAQRRALASVEQATPLAGEGEKQGRVSSPQLLMAAIKGSSRVVEHRLAVRDFDHPAGYGAVTDGLAFMGDAQHPVRPTGEGIALAWADAAVLGSTIAAMGRVGPDVLRAYEQARESEVREVSERVRTAANSFYRETAST